MTRCAQRESGRPRALFIFLVAALLAGPILLLAPGRPAAGSEVQEKPGGGLDSNAQRAEMIKLLRSIDARLQQLVEARK
ncbi:MAG: hypothetical protein HY812_14830 [Planctomycetes bacterium]|nr:hypothetical protein [Planctomycetota bacterium]